MADVHHFSPGICYGNQSQIQLKPQPNAISLTRQLKSALVNVPNGTALLNSFSQQQYLAISEMSKTDFSILSLEKVVTLALPSIITMAIAKQLGADEYGTLVWVMGIAGLLQPITTLGANQLIQALTKSFGSEIHSQKILWAGIKLQVIGSIIALPVYFATISWINDSSVKLMLFLIWLAGLLQSGEVAQYWLLGLGQIRNAAKPSLYSTLTNAALKFGGVIVKSPPIYYCAATAIGSILKTVYYGRQANIIELWKRRKSTELARLTKLDVYISKRSIFYSLSGLSVSVYMQSDVVMLGIMDSKEVAGVYSIICLIASSSTSIASLVPTYLFSKHELKDRSLVSRYFKASSFSSLVFSLIYLLGANAVISYLSGNYQIGYKSILILTPLIYMGTMGSALGNLQNIERLESSALWNTVSGAIANILLNLVLIPRFSLNGAAMAFVISSFIAGYITPWFNKTSKSTAYKYFLNPI